MIIMKNVASLFLFLASSFIYSQEIATTESGRKVILNKNGTFTYSKDPVETYFATSIIKGVVTYYFNKYQGDKPDLGATVVVVDSAQVKNFDYQLWKNYHFASSYRNIYEMTKTRYDNCSFLYKKSKGSEKEKYKADMENAQQDLDKYSKELEKYNAETDEKFKNIDKELFPTLFQFQNGKEPFIETTIDNNGNYSINVPAGVYYVYIKSKNRKGYTITDVSGKTYIDKVKVAKNQNKNVSHNFTL